jgi:hypothetical protein
MATIGSQPMTTLPEPFPRLEAGRILQYRDRLLLVAAVQQSTASATAQALDLDQRLYQLFLTPLGWAIDFAVDRLLRSKSLHEAIRNEDWPGILFWHDPLVPLTEAERSTSAGAIYERFREQERRFKQTGDLETLLREASIYGNQDIILYLLRKSRMTRPALLALIDGIVQCDKPDLLEVVLDYVRKHWPAYLDTASSRAASMAGKYNHPAIVEFLMERGWDEAVEIVSEALTAGHWSLAENLVNRYGIPPLLVSPHTTGEDHRMA